MSAPISKEIQCVICKTSFAPVIQPNEGEEGYLIYCSSRDCANKIFMSFADPVRIGFREALGLSPAALALALQEALADCPCGHPFNHDAGKRCPPCIRKVGAEKKGGTSASPKRPSIWNVDALKKSESKFLDYILEKMRSKGATLQELVARFEAGEMEAEAYLEAIEDMQMRESAQLAVIKTWAMALGPETAFRAAEDLGLVERYGSRVLVTIAAGLKMSTGLSTIGILTREAENWDDPVQKEIKTYLNKIGGA
ncbi:MAG: hypothetical protein ACE5G9_12105 [Nitrospinales bacterium]